MRIGNLQVVEKEWKIHARHILGQGIHKQWDAGVFSQQLGDFPTNAGVKILN